VADAERHGDRCERAYPGATISIRILQHLMSERGEDNHDRRRTEHRCASLNECSDKRREAPQEVANGSESVGLPSG
jgi:hypothetical protein